nr:hypothetical protein [Paracoccus shandongensis]
MKLRFDQCNHALQPLHRQPAVADLGRGIAFAADLGGNIHKQADLPGKLALSAGQHGLDDAKDGGGGRRAQEDVGAAHNDGDEGLGHEGRAHGTPRGMNASPNMVPPFSATISRTHSAEIWPKL